MLSEASHLANSEATHAARVDLRFQKTFWADLCAKSAGPADSVEVGIAVLAGSNRHRMSSTGWAKANHPAAISEAQDRKLVLGHVILDHDVHTLNVHTPPEEICGHQDPLLEVLPTNESASVQRWLGQLLSDPGAADTSRMLGEGAGEHSGGQLWCLGALSDIHTNHRSHTHALGKKRMRVCCVSQRWPQAVSCRCG